EPSQFSTDKLLNLSVKDFNYKADKQKTRYTGLIAQELKLQVPELVLGKEGSYSIDYVKMVPYLLKILQEQQKEIAVLKNSQKGNAAAVENSDATIMLSQMQELQHQLVLQQQDIKRLQELLKK
ncbi:MAG: tail fiber domain-containing protein, partial [Flavobacterium sp.]